MSLCQQPHWHQGVPTSQTDQPTDYAEPTSQVVFPHNGQRLTMRVGIHSGPCASGLIGTKLPKFTIFGEAMNTV